MWRGATEICGEKECHEREPEAGRLEGTLIKLCWAVALEEQVGCMKGSAENWMSQGQVSRVGLVFVNGRKCCCHPSADCCNACGLMTSYACVMCKVLQGAFDTIKCAAPYELPIQHGRLRQMVEAAGQFCEHGNPPIMHGQHDRSLGSLVV